MYEHKFVSLQSGFCIVMRQKRRSRVGGGPVKVIVARRSPTAPDEMGQILEVIDCGHSVRPEGREIAMKAWSEWKQRNRRLYDEIRKEKQKLARKARSLREGKAARKARKQMEGKA